ncbi:hypothetical protein ACFV9C_23330 [Kribbella sp. NPDC059898]|uniref:hypothetical protein n=1 Tax=Kribbella sp. NPDC059898 TaxID=3346995 RepID=UPI003669F64B
MTQFFHTTDAAEAILREGFRDNTGSYMFVGHTPTGVFLGNRPANVNDGAKGDQVLEVRLPDDLDLDEFAIVEEGLPPWEWIVPAELINRRGSIRLLTEDEVDEVLYG